MPSVVQSTGVSSTDNSLTFVKTMGAAAAAAANTILLSFACDSAVLDASSIASVPSATWVLLSNKADGGGINVYQFRTTGSLNTVTPMVITCTSASAVYWSGGAIEVDNALAGTLTQGDSGAGTSSPFSAVTAGSLNANDFNIASTEVNDNSANQGISDPATGGTGSWTSLGAQQATNAHTGFAWAYKNNGTGGAETATWSCNTADSRIGIISGWISAAAPKSLPVFPSFPQSLLNM